MTTAAHKACLRRSGFGRQETALWTCKDGRKVRICDMSDQHLLNAIALLERTAPVRLSQEISAAYSCLSSLRGDMAQFCCEQDIDKMEKTDPIDFLEETMPIYRKLLNDKERRGL